MRLAVAGLFLPLLVAAGAPAGRNLPADEVRPRVEHHVRHAAELADHFDALLRDGCPRLATEAEWRAFVEAEVDRLVLMVAHAEQAWTEAKRTADDDVRRTAKGSRRRLTDARTVIEKWQGCAQEHGAVLELAPIKRRIEREVPRRKAEIALP